MRCYSLEDFAFLHYTQNSLILSVVQQRIIEYVPEPSIEETVVTQSLVKLTVLECEYRHENVDPGLES